MTDPDFLRFMAAPPDEAEADVDAFMKRVIATAEQDDFPAALAEMAALYVRMPGIGQMFKQYAAHGSGLIDA